MHNCIQSPVLSAFTALHFTFDKRVGSAILGSFKPKDFTWEEVLSVT